MKRFYPGTAYALFLGISTICRAQTELQIDVSKDRGPVSPTLYGLMTEEINYSYDGGLYGELIRNRAMNDDPSTLVHWTLLPVQKEGDKMDLDASGPPDTAIKHSLKLTAAAAGVGVANDGFWGIPVKPQATYHASFFAKASASEDLALSIQSSDGAKTFATATVSGIGADWKQYKVDLKTADAAPTAESRMVITASAPGTINLTQVSLFPPTYNDRPSGSRVDLMQKLVDMKPTFLRFPGGNYVEGPDIDNYFDWKKTIGDPAQRPGHMSPWKYRSSDGMGLLEFLEWCQDMHAEPVLAVFAGYTLDKKVVGKDQLGQYVQDALDEIEYVTGGADTKWGARRIADGHPEPFAMHYVEVGNEDQYDRSGSYQWRFPPFFDAIRSKYPKLQIIATTPTTDRQADVIDDHAYFSRIDDALLQAHRHDKRDRKGVKIFMGEWATRPGNSATTDLSAALADAAFLCGIERNSDIVVMSCYAPLLVNVNPGGMQWHGDLIGFNALTSYGSPSYYMQSMFANYLGDTLLSAAITGSPTMEVTLPRARRTPATTAATSTSPATRTVDRLYSTATRDAKTGTIYLKVVNLGDSPTPVTIKLSGADQLTSSADVIVLTSANGRDTNSITEPTKVVPAKSTIDGIASQFAHDFPARSVSVLVLKTK